MSNFLTHLPPKLRHDCIEVSLKNYWRVRKAYKDILGVEGIDHFSLNIFDSQDNVYALSYNPSILYEIFKTGTYLYNGAMSPSFNKNHDFFTWDEAYDKNHLSEMKNLMELKNNIKLGFCITDTLNFGSVTYVFASKNNKLTCREEALANYHLYKKMGEHCFSLLEDVIHANRQ